MDFYNWKLSLKWSCKWIICKRITQLSCWSVGVCWLSFAHTTIARPNKYGRVWTSSSVIARHSLTDLCIILHNNENWIDLELKDLSVDCKPVNHISIYEFALYFATCTFLNLKESLLSWTKTTVSGEVSFPSLTYSITPIFG